MKRDDDMSRPATIFLLIVAPGLAILLVFLGIETLRTNILGWFVLLIGIVYTVGIAIDAYVRKDEFWGAKQSGDNLQEERGDRSFWPIALGIMAAFFLSPVEYLYFATFQLRNAWMESIDVGLVLLGSILFIWARRTLGRHYSGHVSVKKEQELVQSGPYRIIRHPAYAGYLFMALGLALGFSSLSGLVSTLLILLPATVYRIRVEDRLLAEHFGAQFEEYARKKERLLPGVW
jgi:protein-S-isoprenylcysteine O-methyltransferase Ste14